MEASIATEQKILQAARLIFVRDGFDGARMEDIAREAGVNKALLHYYFRSKQKLFDQIFAQLKDQFLPKLHLILTTNASVMENLEMLIEEYLTLLQENPFIPLFLINEAHKNPEQVMQHMALPQVIREAIPHFAQQVQQEIEAGKIRPIDPLQLLMHTISMCVFPVLAQPMMQRFLQLDERRYHDMLAQRKTLVKEFVRAALQP